MWTKRASLFLIRTRWFSHYRLASLKQKRVLVGMGVGTNIIFIIALISMELTNNDVMRSQFILVGFDGSSSQTVGHIPLIIFSMLHNLLTDFMFINASSVYNMVMGRPWIHRLAALQSTYHEVFRYPSPQDMLEIKGDQFQLRWCEAFPKAIEKVKSDVN